MTGGGFGGCIIALVPAGHLRRGRPGGRGGVRRRRATARRPGSSACPRRAPAACRDRPAASGTRRPRTRSACAAVYAPYVLDTAASFETEPPGRGELARRIGAALRDPRLARGRARRRGASATRTRRRTSRARPTAGRARSSVYVGGRAHGGGVGRPLYAALLERLAERGFRTAVAEMTLPNPASAGLHAALGFTPFRGAPTGRLEGRSLARRRPAPAPARSGSVGRDRATGAVLIMASSGRLGPRHDQRRVERGCKIRTRVSTASDDHRDGDPVVCPPRKLQPDRQHDQLHDDDRRPGPAPSRQQRRARPRRSRAANPTMNTATPTPTTARNSRTWRISATPNPSATRPSSAASTAATTELGRPGPAYGVGHALTLGGPGSGHDSGPRDGPDQRASGL